MKLYLEDQLMQIHGGILQMYGIDTDRNYNPNFTEARQDLIRIWFTTNSYIEAGILILRSTGATKTTRIFIGSSDHFDYKVEEVKPVNKP